MSRFLITGVGGFVGGAIARALRSQGHDVIGIGRGEYPEASALGVRVERRDITKLNNSDQALFDGVEAVFHVAARVEFWGAYDDFYATNVTATEKLLELSRAAGVQKFIFTSSPSVVANGKNLRGVDESQPYPAHYDAFYPQTKALAEQAVLRANSADFWTISLRPHLIWGPGDTNLVPTILERARAGRLVQVGSGRNIVDLTKIEDCVQAHLKAETALAHAPQCRGKAYFISQGQPVAMWDWINQVLIENGLAPVTRRIPHSVAKVAAIALEAICKILPGTPEPLLTRFLVDEMATDHYFNIDAARRDLGYQPGQD